MMRLRTYGLLALLWGALALASPVAAQGTDTTPAPPVGVSLAPADSATLRFERWDDESLMEVSAEVSGVVRAAGSEAAEGSRVELALECDDPRFTLLAFGQGAVAWPLTGEELCSANAPVALRLHPSIVVRGQMELPPRQPTPDHLEVAVHSCERAGVASSVPWPRFPVRLEQEGHWWAEIPAGCEGLRLQVGRYEAHHWDALVSPGDGEIDLGRQVLAPGADLEVQIVDMATGRPLDDVAVQIVPLELMQKVAMDLLRGNDAPPLYGRRTETRGWVQISGLSEGRSYLLLSAEGYARRLSRGLDLIVGERLEMESVPLGRPADLRIAVSGFDRIAPDESYRVAVRPIFASGFHPWDGLYATLPSGGWAELPGLTPGSWRVELGVVNPEGMVRSVAERFIELASGEQRLESFAVEGFVVRGRVLRGGEPVAGAVVFHPAFRTPSSQAPSAQADSTGAFEVMIQEEGFYMVELHPSPGRTMVRIPAVGVVPPMDDLVLEVPTGEIVGTVENLGEFASRRVKVFAVHVEAHDRPGPPLFQSAPIRGGSFRLQELAAGTWRVAAVVDGIPGPMEKVELAAGDRQEVQLELETPRTLWGRVTDTTGRPVKGGRGSVACFTEPDAGGFFPAFTTDERGRFQVTVGAGKCLQVALNGTQAKPPTAVSVQTVKHLPGLHLAVPDEGGLLDLWLTGPLAVANWAPMDLGHLWLLPSGGGGLGLGEFLSSGGGSFFLATGEGIRVNAAAVAPGLWRLVYVPDLGELESVLLGRPSSVIDLARFRITPGRATTVRVELPPPPLPRP